MFVSALEEMGWIIKMKFTQRKGNKKTKQNKTKQCLHISDIYGS